ncbi:hypothetical protein I4U23_030134 [Adineta vaga]|nr:hypothetical protein I4U23_030134 [Adineta vaga]
MLAHLSNTSPYVCDLNRGPIEPANRMASAPTKKATAFLEHKESFPKQTRTPLKLLAPDEIPMDTTTTTTDINASLQPIWYTEQTIVDDHYGQQEDIVSIIQEQQQQGKSILPRTTLPPIQSESPTIDEEIEELPNQPSLMHKSSTFTIEPFIEVDSPLNDSEKENAIIESAADVVIPPSDDSFRALEHLLGLGSGTTVRESPKTNHDTLSLTVVTPTDIINSTRRSSRLSFAQKSGADSLPSSQDIPAMPTIESITSTNPPSFLMENTTMEDEQPSTSMTTNQQTTFDLTDNDTIKDDSINDDETNFSFELNDFPNNSNDEPKVVNDLAPPQPMITIRAPTCADVAYRALIKPRTGGRVSQPVKADSPLAKSNKGRSSAPTSRALRSSAQPMAVNSPVKDSTVPEQTTTTNTELVEIVSVPEEDEMEHEKTSSVTLNITSSKESEDIDQNVSTQPEQLITPPKQIAPVLSREYTYNTPKRRSSQRRRSTMNSFYATPVQQEQPETIHEEELHSPSVASNSMLKILMTKATDVVPKVTRKSSIAPSPARTSTPITTNEELINSPSIASKSMLEVLLTKPTEAKPRGSRRSASASSPIRPSKRTTMNQQAINSPSIASKSMLDVLLTKPTKEATPTRASKRNTTVNEIIDSPTVASKSMLEVLLTKPTEAKPRSSRRSASVSSPIRPSKRNTISQQTNNSSSIASQSMLGILLTNPTDNNTSLTPEISIAPSPVRNSTRKSRRSSSNPTPQTSINPLHSSTPSASRLKSIQMVSIGEQEQVTTTAPQQINIEIHREEADIEMVPLNDTTVSIQQPSTIEIGVQTTPSLDKSARHRLNISEQQLTPSIEINKLSSSSSSSSMIIINEEGQQQITPIQTKVVVNYQRNVRFQLTPATDARLVAKEQLEEALRGLKPDIVLEPTPVMPEPKQEKVKVAPIKKATKPKKKVIASKKKKVTRKKKAEPKPKPIQKKTVAARKEKITKQQKATTSTTKKVKKPTKVATSSKRVGRKQTTSEITKKPVAKKISTKRTTTKVSTNAIAKRAAPKATAKRIAKRATQKRTIPKAALESVMEHAKPKQTTAEVKTKIVSKPSTQKQAASKAKTKRIVKPAETKQTIPKVKTEPVGVVKRVASKRITKEIPSEPVAKRASIKRTMSESTTEAVKKRAKITKPVEAKTPTTEATLPRLNLRKTRSGSSNVTKNVSEPAPKKTNKRRLPSVEKTEEPKQKIEKKETEPISTVQTTVSKQDNRQKIEGLTVAELKSRLNKHKEDIPKGAKKADLIALLLKVETNSVTKQAEIEPTTVTPTTKTTRRRKN